MPLVYPLDLTGQAVTNKVTDEIQVLTKLNNHNFYFLIPSACPIFLDNLIVRYKNPTTNIFTTLNKDVDYYPCMPFIGATRAIGKPVYGAITINNLNYNGQIYLTYQTLGGEWTLDQSYVMEQVLEKNMNPRTSAWEEIVNLPTNFPPVPHNWDLVDMVGQSEVLAALQGIEDVLLQTAILAAAPNGGTF